MVEVVIKRQKTMAALRRSHIEFTICMSV